MEDANYKCIEHNHLTKKGGIAEYGHNKGEYEEFWHGDYCCHTDKDAYDPKKDKGRDYCTYNMYCTINTAVRL